MENWDVIIIGAGSAGLAAGIYTVRSGLKTLILDEKLPGGTISDASTVVNYPGFAEISGGELAEKMTTALQKSWRSHPRFGTCHRIGAYGRKENCENLKRNL